MKTSLRPSDPHHAIRPSNATVCPQLAGEATSRNDRGEIENRLCFVFLRREGGVLMPNDLREVKLPQKKALQPSTLLSGTGRVRRGARSWVAGAHSSLRPVKQLQCRLRA